MMFEDFCSHDFCDRARSEGKMGNGKGEKSNGHNEQNGDGEKSEKSAEERCRRVLAFGNDQEI